MNINCNTEEARFLKDISTKSSAEIAEFIQNNYDNYFTNLPSGEYKQELLRKVVENKADFINNNQDSKVGFSQTEVEILKNIKPQQTKRLIYCLMCQAKFNPHEGGWIRLDWPKCLKYGFNQKEILKLRLENLQVCVEYGMEMRVIGSKNPIVCFKIPLCEGPVVIEVGHNDWYKMKAFLTTLD